MELSEWFKLVIFLLLRSHSWMNSRIRCVCKFQIKSFDVSWIIAYEITVHGVHCSATCVFNLFTQTIIAICLLLLSYSAMRSDISVRKSWKIVFPCCTDVSALYKISTVISHSINDDRVRTKERKNSKRMETCWGSRYLNNPTNKWAHSKLIFNFQQINFIFLLWELRERCWWQRRVFFIAALTTLIDFNIHFFRIIFSSNEINLSLREFCFFRNVFFSTLEQKKCFKIVKTSQQVDDDVKVASSMSCGEDQNRAIARMPNSNNLWKNHFIF